MMVVKIAWSSQETPGIYLMTLSHSQLTLETVNALLELVETHFPILLTWRSAREN
jgi:hypothetical protein